jgi:hypothetical protein
MIRNAVLGPFVAALAVAIGPAKAQEFRSEAVSRLSSICRRLSIGLDRPSRRN